MDPVVDDTTDDDDDEEEEEHKSNDGDKPTDPDDTPGEDFSDCEVHSWHINIGLGDGAIHLLVKPASPKPIVQKAVLIDGGKEPWGNVPRPGDIQDPSKAKQAVKPGSAGGSLTRNLKDTITAIRNKYDCESKLHSDPDTNAMHTLRFTSIVVTHWDNDHYGGIKKLLEDDYCDTVRKLQPFVRAKKASEEAYMADFTEFIKSKAFLARFTSSAKGDGSTQPSKKAKPPLDPLAVKLGSTNVDNLLKKTLTLPSGVELLKLFFGSQQDRFLDLQEAFLEARKLKVTFVPRLPAKWDKFDTDLISSGIITIQSRYMLYDSTVNVPWGTVWDYKKNLSELAGHAKACQTTFYCPTALGDIYKGWNYSLKQKTANSEIKFWLGGVAGRDGGTNTRVFHNLGPDKSGYEYISAFQCNLFEKYKNRGELRDNQNNTMSVYVLADIDCQAPPGDVDSQGAYVRHWGGQISKAYFPVMIPHQCKLKIWHEDVLGVELFRNNPCPKPGWKQIFHPADMVKGLRDGEHGLFIVAGNKKVIGETKLLESAAKRPKPSMLPIRTAQQSGVPPSSGGDLLSRFGNPGISGGRRKVIDIMEAEELRDKDKDGRIRTKKTPGMSTVVADDKDSVDTNRASIVCVLLLRTDDGGKGLSEKFDIRHYSAGDALFDVEGGVAKWLTGANESWNSSSKPDKPWTKRANILKLSHHGAKVSTPFLLMDYLNPKMIYAPCPNKANGSWGHPRPEVILAIIGYLMKAQKADSNSPPPLLCQNYPYWFSDAYFERKGPSAGFLRLSSFYTASTDPADIAFIQKIETIFKEGGVKNNIWDAIKISRVRDGNPVSAAQKYKKMQTKILRDHFVAKWNQLSLLEQKYHDNGMLKAYVFTFKPQAETLIMEYLTQTATDFKLTTIGNFARATTKPTKKSLLATTKQVRAITVTQDESDQTFVAEVFTADSGTVSITSTGRFGTGSQTSLEKFNDSVQDVFEDVESLEQSSSGERSAIIPTTTSQKSLLRESMLASASGFTGSSSKTIAVTTQLSIPAGPILFCRSRFTTMTGQDVFRIASESASFDGFISTMNGFLLLEDLPKVGSDIEITLSQNDSWMNSLMNNLLNIQDFKMIANVKANNEVEITMVKCTIQIPTSDTPINLSFSTGNTATSHSQSTTASADVLSKAILPRYNILVLGLAPIVADIPFSEFTDIFQIPGVVDGVDGLPGLGNNFGIQIDSSSGSRCGIFMATHVGYPTSLRLKVKLVDKSKKVKELINDVFNKDVELPDIFLHAVSTATTTEYTDQINITRESKFTLEIPLEFDIEGQQDKLKLTVWISFERNHVTLVADFSKSKKDILGWIMSLPAIKDRLTTDAIKSPSDLFPGVNKLDFKIHQLSTSFNFTNKPFKIVFTDFSVSIEIQIMKAIFLTKLSLPNFKFVGDLWTNVPDKINFLMLPTFEEYDMLYPAKSTSDSNDLQLESLTSFTSGDSSPSMTIPGMEISAEISLAHFEIIKDADKPLLMTFMGEIRAGAPKNSSTPSLDFGTLSIEAYYRAAAKSKPSDHPETINQKSYGVTLRAEAALFPRKSFMDEWDVKPAIIDVEISYANTGWSLLGEVRDLQFAHLYNMFGGDDEAGPIMDILEEISIPYLGLGYMNDKESKDSHLWIKGILRISILELEMRYDYSPTAKTWSFQAATGAINKDHNGEPLKIVDLIKSFDPNSEAAQALSEVPFIGEISIPSVDPTDSDIFEHAPVQLKLVKGKGSMIMWFRIEVKTPAGDLSFLYLQCRKLPTANEKSTQTKSPLKRFIRVQLDNLPKIPDIPVVRSIGQPVDSISYVLVTDSDDVNRPKNQRPGFLAKELTDINQSLPSDIQILTKNSSNSLNNNNSEKDAEDSAALFAGHHIMVVAESEVILDHIFGAKTTTPKVNTITTATAAAAKPANPAAEEDSGSTMGSHQKGFGPLTISNVGIQIKNKHLYILLDATVALGPIKMTLIGFGIGLPLEKNNKAITFNTLSSLVPTDFDVKLAGMDVHFDQPPVLIAGYFEKLDDPAGNYDGYRGGLSVSILPYTLLAIGEYRHTKRPADFKSVFVFARLDGPLFTLEFATISGVKAGFGYNYELTIPSAGQLDRFPLVQGQGSASSDPMEIMRAFGDWNKAKESSMWLAAGFKVDAFQILTVDAAAIVAFSANGIKIAIVAMASASFPPSKSKERPPFAFLYIEIGIVACLDITHGSFMLSAQLTPNSYIYGPFCNIFGGCALCYWFGPSPYAGDWVFTIGGFHPAYKPPPYYPVCPRLGMEWRLLDVLSARGEVYFAITPKAAMAGGKFVFTFSAGPIYACFTALANFLINFKPFYLIADIEVSIEVGIRINLGLISCNLHFDINADLHLQGPPFAGTARVDLWVKKFTIKFGNQNNKPAPLVWDKFLELVKQPGPGATEKSDMIVVVIEKGSYDKKTKKSDRQSGESWWVRGGTFVFRVESKFPVTTIDYGGRENYVQVKSPAGPFYARPMHTGGGQTVSSTLVVSIVKELNGDDLDVQNNSAVSKLKLVEKSTIQQPWLLTPVVKKVPTALWQKYDENSDPMASGDVATILDSSSVADSTIPHIMGYNFVTPDPITSRGDPPDFNAADAMKEGVFPDGVDVKPKFISDSIRLFAVDEPDERPILPVAAPKQDSGMALDRSDPDAPDSEWWDVVKKAWAEADVQKLNEDGDDDWTAGEITGLFVDEWSQAFGWQTTAQAEAMKVQAEKATAATADPQAVGKPQPQPPLVAKKPWEVINEFETFYMGAPWICRDEPVPVIIPVPPATVVVKA